MLHLNTLTSVVEFNKNCEPYDADTRHVMGERANELINNRIKKTNNLTACEKMREQGHVARTKILQCMDVYTPDSNEAQEAMSEWWQVIQHWYDAEDKDFTKILEVYKKAPSLRVAFDSMKPGFLDYFNEVGLHFADKLYSNLE